MNPIGISQPVIVQAPTAPAAAPAPAPINLPQIGAGAAQDAAPQVPEFDAKAAEQQRLAALQRMAQDIANVYIVSDQKFTIFKDATGQYITRFTSLRDGKVTYIPEPTLFKMSHSFGGEVLPVVTLKA